LEAPVVSKAPVSEDPPVFPSPSALIHDSASGVSRHSGDMALLYSDQFPMWSNDWEDPKSDIPLFEYLATQKSADVSTLNALRSLTDLRVARAEVDVARQQLEAAKDRLTLVKHEVSLHRRHRRYAWRLLASMHKGEPLASPTGFSLRLLASSDRKGKGKRPASVLSIDSDSSKADTGDDRGVEQMLT
jgi:hypothetical protein